MVGDQFGVMTSFWLPTIVWPTFAVDFAKWLLPQTICCFGPFGVVIVPAPRNLFFDFAKSIFGCVAGDLVIANDVSQNMLRQTVERTQGLATMGKQSGVVWIPGVRRIVRPQLQLKLQNAVLPQIVCCFVPFGDPGYLGKWFVEFVCSHAKFPASVVNKQQRRRGHTYADNMFQSKLRRRFAIYLGFVYVDLVLQTEFPTHFASKGWTDPKFDHGELDFRCHVTFGCWTVCWFKFAVEIAKWLLPQIVLWFVSSCDPGIHGKWFVKLVALGASLFYVGDKKTANLANKTHTNMRTARFDFAR